MIIIIINHQFNLNSLTSSQLQNKTNLESQAFNQWFTRNLESQRQIHQVLAFQGKYGEAAQHYGRARAFHQAVEMCRGGRCLEKHGMDFLGNDGFGWTCLVSLLLFSMVFENKCIVWLIGGRWFLGWWMTFSALDTEIAMSLLIRNMIYQRRILSCMLVYWMVAESGPNKRVSVPAKVPKKNGKTGTREGYGAWTREVRWADWHEKSFWEAEAAHAQAPPVQS